MLSPLAAVKPPASDVPVPEYVAADHRTSKSPAVVGVMSSAHGLEVQVVAVCWTRVKDTGAMVSARFTVWVCEGLPESVTEKVSAVAFAVAVGLPVMAAVAGFRVKPAGSEPELMAQV